MQKIDSQQTADGYTQACRLEEVWNSSGGYFQISVADVFMQLQWGPKGQEQWTNEVHVGASSSAGASGVLNPGTIGVAFRSYTAGTPATVSAALAAEAEPPLYLTSSSANNQTVSGVGTELAYAQFAAIVPISATTDATADLVVTAPAFTADGTMVVLIQCFAPEYQTGANVGAQIVVNLYEDGADIGRLFVSAQGSGLSDTVNGWLRRTPAAGSRVYSMRAWRITANGSIEAGAGGAGTRVPGYIRVTQAV